MIPGNINTDLISGAEGGGYQIQRSLRFNASDSAYLSRTPASAGNRRTFTWSGWIKRSKLGLDGCRLFVAGSGANIFLVRMLTTDVLEIDFYNGTDYGFDTVAVFRDVSAWYHILVSVDTTQATAADRFKVYVNGAQITTLTSFGNVPQNTDLPVNNTVAHAIGNGGGNYYDGYLADIHFIDGQALTPSSFAETNATTGQWVPKAYSGSYGTNGFQLKFADNSNNTAATLGKDTSGNSNNWTPNNLSITAGAGNDSLVDTPTSYGTDTGAGGEVRGNYCTWNPLTTTQTTLSDGNLQTSGAGGLGCTSTFVVPASGKYYCEITITTTPENGQTECVGVGPIDSAGSLSRVYNSAGEYYNGSAWVALGSAWSINDVIGIGINADVGQISFYRNGTIQGSAQSYSFTSKDCVKIRTKQSGTSTFVANFGQRAFAYTAPSGFKALCDTNLPAPVVAKPNTAFDVVTYTGNGSARSITLPGGFSPDLIWTKSRSTNYFHHLYDIIRGTNSDLSSNSTSAESTGSPYNDGVTAFNSNGYTLGAFNGLNENGTTYVAWCFDAGSNTVSNTAGSITSQVRANASAGFSIVTYTGNGTNGATVGHGLGVSPGMVIVKARSAAYEWPVYHSSLSAGQGLFLNNNGAAGSVSSQFNWGGIGGANSTTFTCTQGVSTINNTNLNGNTYVAYVFSPVAGYSSFGSYVGNGTTNDGTFVYLGFRPKFVMVKNASSSGDWNIWDSVRDTDNVIDLRLRPNTSESESSLTNAFNNVDFLSNGFKLRGSAGLDSNSSGATYIYAAFAESPFQYARAR